ncbi:hypothetical protein OTU49_007751 [Cherax quadricarinatus]|uniref:BTB domain-containing protein n=1 Tax=Cherax quadricarinatus TaxID=27406 RepID=A0AAW0WUC3_CHEQU
MDGGLLCLKWRDHRSTFFRMLSSVRKKEIYCDATIACDGKFYPVHRLVLSTCSEFFERMFEVADNKHLMIVLTDIQHEYLETLLDYMYIGEVNVLQSDLSSFMKAAECLKIRGLAEPSETNPRKECADSKRNMPQREDGWEIKRRRQNDDLPVNSKPETKSSLGGNSLDNLNSAKVPPRSRTSCGEPKRGRDPSLGHTKINNIPASGIVSPAQLALAELASEKQAGSSSNLTSSLSKDHDNDSSISHDTELSDCKSSQVKFEDVNVKEEPEDWPQAESNEDPQLFRFSDPGLAYLANASTLPLPVQGISQTTQAQTGPLEHSAHPLPGPSGLHSLTGWDHQSLSSSVTSDDFVQYRGGTVKGVNQGKRNMAHGYQVGRAKRRGRCRICPRKDDKKTDTQCSLCTKWVCKLHSVWESGVVVCYNCRPTQWYA